MIADLDSPMRKSLVNRMHSHPLEAQRQVAAGTILRPTEAFDLDEFRGTLRRTPTTSAPDGR